MTLWNMRLRGPRGKQIVLKLDPEINYKTFSELAAKELGLKAKDRLICTHMSLWCFIAMRAVNLSGFPPRAVEVEASTLVKNVFEANDTVVVDMSSGTTASVPATAIAAKTKRADVKKTTAKVPRHGVHKLNSLTSLSKKALPKRKIIDSGHQLGSSLDNSSDLSGAVEDEDAGDNEDEPQRKYRRSRAVHLTSKEGVEISLVNAVSGQSNDRATKFFRAATKNAVEHQYELTLATSRLNAALSRNFEIEELSNSRRADGSAAKLRVRFKETSRKWKEETVDLLKTNELQAILKYVLLSGGEAGREMLKPFNMAQVSTRVFWSIAHMYDGDVAIGLADLVPDEDWSFLDTRTRVMSEKAIEAKTNEEQYVLWKQSHTRRGGLSSLKPEMRQDTSKVSAAKEKKSEMSQVNSDARQELKQEAAVSKCAQTSALLAEEATSSTLSGAVAQAAHARFDRNLQASVVISELFQEKKLATQFTKKQTAPSDNEKMESEDDVEEAITVYCDSCKKARILSPEEAANSKLDKDPWTCASLVKTGRGGGCEDIDDELAQITGVSIAEWLQKAAITTRRELADATVISTMHALVNPSDPAAQVLREKFEKLIDEARLDEVNDWMLELVGEADMVQRLEVQKLGTPADLIVTPSDLILEAVGNTCSTTNVSIDEISSWQTRAQRLVDKHPWLADWRTL
ncbi:hypothetical protein DD237_000033 [Peronospora effusa]|uniref:CW-type domain-containing protein n=1 Tax=Peronospora effusa TaxID=542832 RepID=A0A3R7W8B3_9STRA|nr:hypothetical protein DD237_000033 [Peronospora effusa]